MVGNALMSAIGTGAKWVGSTAVNVGSKLLNTWYQRKQSEKLMKKQNDYNVQNWYRENSYNTPSAQMDRLRMAGLNPNLIYQGASGANQSGTIDPVSAQSISDPRLGDVVPEMIDAYHRGNQLDIQEDQLWSLIAYREALNSFNRSRKEGQDIANAINEHDIPYASANAYQKALQLANQTKMQKEQIDKARSETALNWQNNRYTRQARKNLAKQYDLTEANIQQLETGMRKMNTEIWQIYYNAGLARMQYDLSAAEKTAVISKYNEEMQKLQAETANINTTNELKSFLAHGRKRLTDELDGKHGKINQAAAQLLFSVYDIMANMPFSGLNINP